MDRLSGVVKLLMNERDRLTKELRGITAALAAFGNTYARGTGSRQLSAAARGRIAAAQRARWAKARQNSAESQRTVPVRAKRKLSAAARKRIAAAQRARWAKLKAAKKNS